jgi:hypothetical protein
MLSVEIDEARGVAILVPAGPLASDDFESAAGLIDPYIERAGHLNGLVIHMQAFPGWDSFAALISHLRFVKEHHRKISRVAFSTESRLGSLAEALGGHFVSAEIRVFPYQDLQQAKNWVADDTADRAG